MFPHSPRLAYREMVPGDLGDMARLLGDPAVMSYYPRPKTRDGAAGQNQGLATEAAAACRDFAQRALGASRLIAIIDPGNVPSQRVAAKIGLRPETRTAVHGRESIIFAAALDGPHGK
jgi:hypothetical protein